MPTDIGWILQSGTLLVDDDRLEKATRKFLSDLPVKAQEEAKWLKDNRIDVALCDMPIWSIEACCLAEVPLLFVGNFTWAELYQEHLPKEIWQAYGEKYQKVRYALLYALYEDHMLPFLQNAEKEEISLVAREFSLEKAAGIHGQDSRPLIFVALGMSASFHEKIDVPNLPYRFIANIGTSLVGDNVKNLSPTTMDSQNYLLASDYVISKAGWTTVAEALLAKKKLALFSRDTVLEDRCTIAQLEVQKLAIKIEPDDLNNIPRILSRMDEELSDEGFVLYNSSVEVIAEKLITLGEKQQ